MISKSQRTSINKAKTGRKGPNNTNGYPVVLSEALSASNNKCTKVQFSASSTKSLKPVSPKSFLLDNGHKN